MLRFVAAVLRAVAEYLEECDTHAGQIDQSPYVLVERVKDAADAWAKAREER